jgi:hypothetical protein
MDEEMSEEELKNHPLLPIAGILDIGGPGWADRHDEHFAGVSSNEHIPERNVQDVLADLDRLAIELAPYWSEDATQLKQYVMSGETSLIRPISNSLYPVRIQFLLNHKPLSRLR